MPVRGLDVKVVLVWQLVRMDVMLILHLRLGHVANLVVSYII